jgi:gamma-glutamylcyclotransferase (GGCT)/AIG2-like uncharacterized protein YtfP
MSLSEPPICGNKLLAQRNKGLALFVYGSLLDRFHREQVLGHPVRTVTARLPGYERLRKRYFYVVPRVGGETPGLLLLDLSQTDFKILDRYEEVPRLYTRERAEVLDEAGKPMRCWLYMLTKESVNC